MELKSCLLLSLLGSVFGAVFALVGHSVIGGGLLGSDVITRFGVGKSPNFVDATAYGDLVFVKGNIGEYDKVTLKYLFAYYY